MKNIVNTYVGRFLHERRARVRMICVLAVLAAVVVVGVFWRLHYTGIAMTNEVYCGMEEHTHDESCYEKVPICGMTEGEGAVGGQEAVCESVRVLTCSLEESEGHTHDDSCRDKDGNLICGLEEAEGHTHDESCYETEKVLVSEAVPAAEGHVHTDACYETVLRCTIPEHTHTIECMTDETADVETAADWEAILPALTGVWADDVAAVAISQIGYTESTANFRLAEDGETHQGYTRYGAWYGNPYGDWDGMFAAFVLHYAGVDEAVFPEDSGAYAWVRELKEKELYADADDYSAAAGDLVFLDGDGDGSADRVGILTAVSESKITVVEGDSDDAVAENTYQPNASAIVGYGLLPKQDEEKAQEPAPEAIRTAAAGSAVDITARSSSPLKLTWTPAKNHTDTITVKIYDMSDGNAEIPASTTYSFNDITTTGQGTAKSPYTADFVISDLADRLTLDGGSSLYSSYRYVYATVSASSVTYGGEDKSVERINLQGSPANSTGVIWPGPGSSNTAYQWSHQLYYANGSSSDKVSGTGSAYSNLTVNLYYDRTDPAVPADTVSGTINVTYNKSTGNRSTVASGAYVAVHDESGNAVCSGKTDSSGNFTAEGLVLGNTYYVDIEYSSGSSFYGLDSYIYVTGAGLQPNETAALRVAADNATYNYKLGSYSKYDHIDIEVSGTYTLTVGDARLTFTSYIDPDYLMTIVLPDGEVVTGNGTSRKGGEAGMEYNFPGSYSGQWDDWAHYKKKTNPKTHTTYYETPLLGSFSISGYVLISHDEVEKYVDAGAMTREQENAFFDGCEVISVDNHVSDAGIPAGKYYLVEYSDYDPGVNVCTAMKSSGFGANSRGYDFEIDLQNALVYLTERLIVEKYVVNEAGEFIYSSGYDSGKDSEYRTPEAAGKKDDTEFTFTLEKVNAGGTESKGARTATIKSGKYYIFDDLEPGFYMITEAEAQDYVPVSWDGKQESWNPSGYVQWASSRKKEDGSIASVTFYNMKQENYGTVTVKKTVDDETESGAYAGKYYLMNLYTATEKTGSDGGTVWSDFTPVTDIGTKGNSDICLGDGGSASFSLQKGTYFIKESDQICSDAGGRTGEAPGEDVSWIEDFGDLERVADADGTAYYRFTVEAKGTATVTVTNIFSDTVYGAELPQTGGMGTKRYTSGGLLIIALAAAGLVYIRKRKERGSNALKRFN